MPKWTPSVVPDQYGATPTHIQVYVFPLNQIGLMHIRLCLRNGQDVRRERMMRDMSQSDLADAVGIAENMISRIERGDRKLVPDVADRIAGAFYRVPPIGMPASRPPETTEALFEQAVDAVARTYGSDNVVVIIAPDTIKIAS